MEKLPREILDIIFEDILVEDPFKLYSLRVLSKSWKENIDLFLNRSEVWHKLCLKYIPENCRNDILKKKFPLSMWPWQRGYWNNPKRRTCRTLFKAWKKLNTLTQERYAVEELEANKRYSFSLTVGNHLVVSVSSDVRISTLKNFQESDYAFPSEFSFAYLYKMKGHTYAIVHNEPNFEEQDEDYNTYITNAVDDEPELLNLKRCPPLWDIFIVENEFFYVDEYTVKHYVYENDNIYNNQPKLSSEFTLPKAKVDEYYVVSSFQVNGNDLHVLCAYPYGCPLWGKALSFTYEMTRMPDGKLSFSYRATQNWDTTDIGENLETITKSTRILKFSRYLYLRTESSSLFIDQEIDDKVCDTFSLNFEFYAWFLLAHNQECTKAFSYANHLIVGTNEGSIFVFRGDDYDNLSGLEDGVLPAAWRQIELPVGDGDQSIEYIDIVFKGCVPIILARTKSKFFSISFSPEN